VKSVFVARYLGDDGEAARAVMAQVWALLRPYLLDRPACPPRIWLT
jgi:urease accessory protein